MSRCNCATTAAGVPATATRAAQGCISTGGAPASARVGIWGWLASRVLAATASGRSRPLAIRPATVLMPMAVKSTSLAATAASSAPASLNGTCSIRTSAARASVSIATWLAWPLPSVA